MITSEIKRFNVGDRATVHVQPSNAANSGISGDTMLLARGYKLDVYVQMIEWVK